MRREATVLGPLLESAYLDANHLRKLYNEGVGSAAANALLEQAGQNSVASNFSACIGRLCAKQFTG